MLYGELIGGLKEWARSRDLFSLLKGSVGYVVRHPDWVRNWVRLLLSSDSVVENRGVRMDMDTAALSFQTKRKIIEGWFGPDEASVDRIAGHLAGEAEDIVEIGAGTGWMSARVNRRLADACTHVAVEPNPWVIPVLERTRALNDCTFDIENAAYKADEEEVEFKLYEDYNDATLLEGRGPPTAVERVAACTLSDIARKHELSRFVLYSNMEGGEYELIDRELDLVMRRCPSLIISFHDFPDYEPGEYLRRLDDVFEREWSTRGTPGTHLYRNPSLAGSNSSQ